MKSTIIEKKPFTILNVIPGNLYCMNDESNMVVLCTRINNERVFSGVVIYQENKTHPYQAGYFSEHWGFSNITLFKDKLILEND